MNTFLTVLSATAVLGALGLGFGALLALAARRFAVEVDPRISEVEEALPGLNCGVCGYPGCSPYAEAVVGGRAPVDSCKLGGAETSQAVARIMGLELADGEDPGRAYLLCGGGSDKVKQRFEYVGMRDCHMAAALGGGPSACEYGCVGFGSCVSSCPLGLISMGPDDLPVIDSDACTGCGECVRTCPKHVIALLPTGNEPVIACRSYDRGKTVKEVCPVGCISCQLCVKACPEDAISMDESMALAAIDYDKCTNCGKCVEVCPTNTILSRQLLHGAIQASLAEQQASA